VPKTFNNLWCQITCFENLFEAYKEARKGKRYRDDVLNFSYNLEENLINLQNKLLWKLWRPGKFRSFYVYDPKKRLIQAPPFQDRVVHHALVKIIEPLFERKFIYDSYACRKGKGIHAATLRLQAFLRRAKRNWRNVYVLKADISKYFPSINHNRLIQIIARTIRDKNTLWLCERIIKDCGYEVKGIPVGALTSQLFANIYLDQLDHYLKDDLGIKYYLRYMDDFVILERAKPELRELLYRIEEFLACKLLLCFNPKTSISPTNKGVDFAGYRTWATHILPRKRNVKRARRRLKKLARLYSRKLIPLEEFKASLMSFLGYIKHCCGCKTLKEILHELVLIRRSS